MAAPPAIPNIIAMACRVPAVLACWRAAAVSPLAKAFDTSFDSHMAKHPRGQQQKRNTNTDLARKNIGAHLRDNNEQPGQRCSLSLRCEKYSAKDLFDGHAHAVVDVTIPDRGSGTLGH